MEVCVGEPPPALAFPGTDSAALSSFGRDGSFAADAGKRDVPRADSCRLAGNTHGACPQRPWADSGTVGPSGDPRGDPDLPRPCPESRDLVRDRQTSAVGAAQLGGGSPRMGGGCIPEGWWVPLAGWWAHSNPPPSAPHQKHHASMQPAAPHTVQRPGSAQRDAPQRAGSIPTPHARGTLEGREGIAEQMGPRQPPGTRLGWEMRVGWQWVMLPAAGLDPAGPDTGCPAPGCGQGEQPGLPVETATPLPDSAATPDRRGNTGPTHHDPPGMSRDVAAQELGGI